MSKENTCQSCTSDHYHSLGEPRDHFPKGKCIKCADKCNCGNVFYYHGKLYCRTCFPDRYQDFIDSHDAFEWNQFKLNFPKMSEKNTCQPCNSGHYHSLGKSSDHFPKGKCIQCADKCNCGNGLYYSGTLYCRTCFPNRNQDFIDRYNAFERNRDLIMDTMH